MSGFFCRTAVLGISFGMASLILSLIIFICFIGHFVVSRVQTALFQLYLVTCKWFKCPFCQLTVHNVTLRLLKVALTQNSVCEGKVQRLCVHIVSCCSYSLMMSWRHKHAQWERIQCIRIFVEESFAVSWWFWGSVYMFTTLCFWYNYSNVQYIILVFNTWNWLLWGIHAIFRT